MPTIADKIAPCYPTNNPTLKAIAAHYTVEAYATNHEAYLGPLWRRVREAGYPEGHLTERWRTAVRAAGSAYAAAAALNGTLWGEDVDTVEVIHDLHDGEGEAAADRLDGWLERHGIDIEKLLAECEAEVGA